MSHHIVGLYLEAKGLISCQLDSFNSLVTQGIHDIVMSKSNREVRCAGVRFDALHGVDVIVVFLT